MLLAPARPAPAPAVRALLCVAALLFAASPAHAAIRYVAAGSPHNDVQDAINASSSGDQVVLRAGVHEITRDLKLRSGVTLRGDWAGQGTTTLRGDASFPLRLIPNGTSLTGATVNALRLENVRIQLSGNAGHNRIRDNAILNCDFRGLKESGTVSAYVNLSYGRDNRIVNCVFRRTDPANFGRAIKLFKTHAVTIDRCTVTGYFTNAININGVKASDPGNLSERPKQTLIQNCTFTRTPSPSERNAVGQREDHGVYASNFYDLRIQDNTISGWSPTGLGGSAKIRNGEGGSFSNNTCNGSGVLLYTYQSDQPQHLKNFSVNGNQINHEGAFTGQDPYRGILYYRNWSGGTEVNIHINDNRIPEGNIFIGGNGNRVDPSFNGGVRRNKVAKGGYKLAENVTAVGNTTY